MNWNVYLSGEIHSDWRGQIIDGAEQLSLDLSVTSAVTKHAASDATGNPLGAEENSFWRDHKSFKVNSLRTKTMIKNCDIAVICTY